MQETVTSAKSEAKKELRQNHVQGYETVQRFNISNVAGKNYSGGPELWSLWYSTVYTDLFESINQILLTPIEKRPEYEGMVYSSIENNLENLAERISSTDEDVQPILNIQERLERFRDAKEDEITIRVTIHGPNTTVECIEEYYNHGIVTVDLDGKATRAEKSTLLEYEDSLVDAFCSWEDARPNKRFQRELHISFKKTSESTEATIDVEANRMKYTQLEKLFLKLGFSSPYKEEPVKNL